MAFALLFRYAERDHEQLSVLCRQKAEMEQKLLTKKVKVEEKSGLDLPLSARAFQIFVDIRRILNKRTIVLMVRSTTTVGEVKEMLKTKTDIPPVLVFSISFNCRRGEGDAEDQDWRDICGNAAAAQYARQVASKGGADDDGL